MSSRYTKAGSYAAITIVLTMVVMFFTIPVHIYAEMFKKEMLYNITNVIFVVGIIVVLSLDSLILHKNRILVREIKEGD